MSDTLLGKWDLRLGGWGAQAVNEVNWEVVGCWSFGDPSTIGNGVGKTY